MPVTMKQVARFKSLFRGREDAYGQYTVGKDGSSKLRVSTLTGEAPDEAWVRHLEGCNPGMGIVPVTGGGNCYWGAIDYDDIVEPFEIAEDVEKKELPLVVCRSKSGGVHLFVFLIDPVTAEIMITKLKAWARVLGIERNTQGKKGKGYPTEIFPKQTEASTGNWINLPYFGSGKSNLRWGIIKGKRVNNLDRWLTYAESRKVSAIQFSSWSVKDPTDIFGEGPPCLEQFHKDGVQEGGRNVILFNMGLFFKQSQPEDWTDVLTKYNQEHVYPPLLDEELEITIKQIQDGTYWYQCDQTPLCDTCNQTECDKRQYGIGTFKTGVPKGLGQLTYIAAEPARWIVRFDTRDVTVNTEQLLSSIRFRTAVVEQLGLYFPPVKQAGWDRFIRKAMETKKTITPPREASVFGRFLTLLGQFVEKRRGASSDSDLRRGKPVEKTEDGEVYVVFALEGLRVFLERNRFYDYKDTDLYSRLKALNATSRRTRVDDIQMRVWWVPYSSLAEFIDDDDIAPSHSKSPSF